MSTFKKAARVQIPLKLGITGPSGSGKTTAALRLATGLANGGKIACVDTENSSASLYADLFEFDVIDLSPPFSDSKFIEAIDAAVREDYSVLIIDSFSHCWTETLEFKAGLDSKGGNSYTNWNFAGKKFGNVLAKLLHSPLHVLGCMRSKMDHIQEEDAKGKKVVRKLGMAPIMRENIEYDFTTVFDLGTDHYATVSKDRTRMFTDLHFEVTEETGRQLLNWLNSAPEPVVPPPAPPVTVAVPNGQSVDFTHEGKIETASQTPNKQGKPCYGAVMGGMTIYTFDPEIGEVLLSLVDKPAKFHLRPNGRPGRFEILDIEVPTLVDTDEDQIPF